KKNHPPDRHQGRRWRRILRGVSALPLDPLDSFSTATRAGSPSLGLPSITLTAKSASRGLEKGEEIAEFPIRQRKSEALGHQGGGEFRDGSKLLQLEGDRMPIHVAHPLAGVGLHADPHDGAPVLQRDRPGQVFRRNLSTRLENAFQQPSPFPAHAHGAEIWPHALASSFVAMAIGAEGDGGMMENPRSRLAVRLTRHSIEAAEPSDRI